MVTTVVMGTLRSTGRRSLTHVEISFWRDLGKALPDAGMQERVSKTDSGFCLLEYCQILQTAPLILGTGADGTVKILSQIDLAVSGPVLF